MLRNLALTFAAVTFRGWLGLFIAVQLPLLDSVYGGAPAGRGRRRGSLRAGGAHQV